MTAGRTPHYEFAVLTHAHIGVERIVDALRDVQREFPKGLLSAQLFGRASTAEVALLLRFSFFSYSSALRRHITREAERMSGKVLDPQILPPDERERFYDKKLVTMTVREELTLDGALAPLQRFFAQMRAVPTPAPAPKEAVLEMKYDTPAELAQSLQAWVAEGVIRLPTAARHPVGTALRILLTAGGGRPLEVKACVLQPAQGSQPLMASLESTDAARGFLEEHAQVAREGRALLRNAKGRGTDRYHTRLQVTFADADELRTELVTNISQGGVFVKTLTPPPVHSKVRLALVLPDGEPLETDAEVVHVVTAAEAQSRGIPAGAGFSFDRADVAFRERVAALLARYAQRKPRVLVVDDDNFFRQVLSDALSGAGFEVITAGTGEDALRVLIEQLYALDLLTLDLNMPGMGVFGLIDRIRRLGGETDLRVVVISSRGEEKLEVLRQSGHVSAALSKGVPVPEMMRQILSLLGRNAG